MNNMLNTQNMNSTKILDNASSSDFPVVGVQIHTKLFRF